MSRRDLHYNSGHTFVLLKWMSFLFSQRYICYLINKIFLDISTKKFSKRRNSRHILLDQWLTFNIKHEVLHREFSKLTFRVTERICGQPVRSDGAYYALLRKFTGVKLKGSQAQKGSILRWLCVGGGRRPHLENKAERKGKQASNKQQSRKEMKKKIR